MVNNVDDMTVVHKKMESLGPVHQRNRCSSAKGAVLRTGAEAGEAASSLHSTAQTFFLLPKIARLRVRYLGSGNGCCDQTCPDVDALRCKFRV
jgi:hypothetical protein